MISYFSSTEHRLIYTPASRPWLSYGSAPTASLRIYSFGWRKQHSPAIHSPATRELLLCICIASGVGHSFLSSLNSWSHWWDLRFFSSTLYFITQKLGWFATILVALLRLVPFETQMCHDALISFRRLIACNDMTIYANTPFLSLENIRIHNSNHSKLLVNTR